NFLSFTFASRTIGTPLFRSSSMAEHSAVNRRVVGSSPTCGANIYNNLRELKGSLLLLHSFGVGFLVSFLHERVYKDPIRTAMLYGRWRDGLTIRTPFLIMRQIFRD